MGEKVSIALVLDRTVGVDQKHKCWKHFDRCFNPYACLLISEEEERVHIIPKTKIVVDLTE